MRCKPIPNPFPMSKCLFCSKKNFLLYFLKKYYNLIYIGYRYRYRPIRQKIISVFYRYRPIRNLNLSVIIGIGQYEKKLIGRPLLIVIALFMLYNEIIRNDNEVPKVLVYLSIIYALFSILPASVRVTTLE